MAQENNSGKLIGLILTVLAIAVLVMLLGTLCTCLCTCGTCVGFNGCMPVCSKFEWLPDHSDAWLETDEPVVSLVTAPTATTAPTAGASTPPWRPCAAT